MLFNLHKALIIPISSSGKISALHKLNIKKVNCWLENHEQKGWNFGFRKYFPNVETFRYQGFPHFPQLMNTVPAKFEEKYKVIPKKVIIIGEDEHEIQSVSVKEITKFKRQLVDSAIRELN